MTKSKYTVAAIQSDVRTADETDPDSADETVRENLDRNMELVDYLWMDPRYGPDLMVFSEFCLTSVPESRKLEGYQNIAVELPGFVTDIVGEKAAEHGAHIVMNTFEKDPKWPDRVFNCSFMVGPEGDVVLKYRKLNDVQPGIPCSSNPGDFYQEYIDEEGGPEALFPVVDTELGKLACQTCYDVNFAEVTRCLALQGAEVICHPTAEPSNGVNHRASWDAAKQVRAWENQVYFVSVNNGRTLNGSRPVFRQRGLSKVIGPDGGVIAKTDGGGESLVTATVELERLREDRLDAIGRNVPASSRYRTYLPIYEQQEVWPEDAFADEPQRVNHDITSVWEQARENAVEKGVFTPPESGGD